MHHFHKPVNQGQDRQPRLGRRNPLSVEAFQNLIHQGTDVFLQRFIGGEGGGIDFGHGSVLGIS